MVSPSLLDRARFFEDLGAMRLDAVLLALQDGMPPGVQNESDESALNVAIDNRFRDGVRALLEAGANINHRDRSRVDETLRFPLERAIRARDLDMIELLLANDADPRLTNEKGQNAAHLYVDSGQLDLNMAAEDFERRFALFDRMLSLHGVANKMDRQGTSPLHLMLGRVIHSQALSIALSRGCDPDLMTNSGARAIHHLWSKENLFMLRQMVEHGVSVDSRDRDGTSALSYAADVEAVVELLQLGANINHLDDLGRNALAFIFDHQDNRGRRLEVCKQLVAAGIDTSRKDITRESVDSRLAGAETPKAQELQALIAATRARAAMTDAAGSMLPRPA
jgi:ankyrin repeat protein